jgi:hypothetical protein
MQLTSIAAIWTEQAGDCLGSTPASYRRSVSFLLVRNAGAAAARCTHFS